MSYESTVYRKQTSTNSHRGGRPSFTSTSVRLDWNAIVHFVNPHDLVVAAVSTEFIILTHDERFDWLGWAYFRTQPTERTAGQIKIKIIQDFYFVSWFAVTTQVDQLVRAHLSALVANDAGLGPCFWLNL